MSYEINEIESNFCPCGAILLPDKRIKEDGKDFLICAKGHKILILRPSTQREKGRAVSL